MIRIKNAVDIACGIMFAVSAMAAVGPVTTLQGTGYCVLVMAITGAWLWNRGLLEDNTPVVVIEPINRKVNNGHTHMVVGQYPRVNPYTRRVDHV